MFSPGAFCIPFRVSPIRLSSELLACCVPRITYPSSLHPRKKHPDTMVGVVAQAPGDKCFKGEQGNWVTRGESCNHPRGKERNLWIKEPDTH